MLTSLNSLGVAMDGGEAADAAQASKQTIMRALEREVRPDCPLPMQLMVCSPARNCNNVCVACSQDCCVCERIVA